jgi:hypothetical protein
MKERPILFSGPMVRAILDGRKTMTRRVVKPMPGKQSEWLTQQLINKVPHGEIIGGGWQMHHPKADQRMKTVVGVIDIAHDSPLGWIRCPYGEVGDRLYVREAHWRFKGEWTPKLERDGADTWPTVNAEYLAYALDEEGDDQLANLGWKKCPSIHMPRRASRITLEITGVRVERLKDISEADTHAEGVPNSSYAINVIQSFAFLWDKINGKKHPWASNPWVWVVEFKKI